MAAQLRVLRRRIRSVKSTQKITRAMQLIATARIAKAQARVEASRPYAEEIGTVLSALASASVSVDSPLTVPLLAERDRPERAAVLVVTSDRGLAGGYNANVLRAAEELQSLLREQGKTPKLYVVGRKGVGYYRFRQRDVVQSWTGFSEQPGYSDAADIGRTLVASFLAGADDPDAAGVSGGDDAIEGVDELHVVYTRFVSMLTQSPTVRRMAPLEVEYVDGDGSADGARGGSRDGARGGTAGAAAPGSADADGAAPRGRDGLQPSFEFEPDAEALLGTLLPKYVNTRIYAALLDAAASESAARRQAMQAATDNANDLIQALTREANQARQGQITQEISEIVGGAEALSAAGSEE